MPKKIDMTGERHGRLTFLAYSHHKNSRSYWHTRCTCGTLKIIDGYNARKGLVTSCGCYMRELHTKHGYCQSRTWVSWREMKQRCLNPNNPRWKDYGGRGITVHIPWIDFRNFLADMGERPEGTSLDRIDNDDGYKPSNCKWSTPAEQQNNTKTNTILTYKGTTKNLRAWSDLLGIRKDTLRTRIKRGWTLERAFNQSVKRP